MLEGCEQLQGIAWTPGYDFIAPKKTEDARGFVFYDGKRLLCAVPGTAYGKLVLEGVGLSVSRGIGARLMLYLSEKGLDISPVSTGEGQILCFLPIYRFSDVKRFLWEDFGVKIREFS